MQSGSWISWACPLNIYNGQLFGGWSPWPLPYFTLTSMEPTTRNYDFSERKFCPLLVASSWAPQKLLYIEVSIWSMRGPELFRPILHDQEQDGRFVIVSSVNVLAEKHYTHRHIWLRGPTFAALRRQRYGSRAGTSNLKFGLPQPLPW